MEEAEATLARLEGTGSMTTKTRVPAKEGWFTMDDDAPTLLGRRGAETGSYFFPPTLAFSRNPAAPAEELEEVALSRRGRVWSWTTNHYQPPEPYVAARSVRAVHRRRGRAGRGADGRARAAGARRRRRRTGRRPEVELALTPLYEDDDHEYVIWCWRVA